ncbi:hypothetical protein FB45DRAFT_478117 [Roridomyces roridus]|uniref:Transmembrane protein n=1 Tax=Roridomyces roridus TaxID=1738132 RepID=A0AAD7BZM2_9AGAR|nr:hypothetical protein FB45DRAFT_478117 [Roridomyces roridus]
MHSAVTVLFNPRWRVYNFRLLSLAAIGTIIYFTVTYGSEMWNIWAGKVGERLYPSLGVILLHHGILIFNWKIPGLAVLDLLFVVLELGAMCYFMTFERPFSFVPKDKYVFIPLVVLLAFSMIFRVTTIVKSPTRFYCQPFALLGGCQKVVPAYTPMSVLLNRSIARPLVGGEATPIILLRAFVISCIAVGLPAVGIYYIIIMPIQAQSYTRELAIESLSGTTWPSDGLPSTVLMGSFIVNSTACGLNCTIDWSTLTGTFTGPTFPTSVCQITTIFVPGGQFGDDTALHRFIVCPYPYAWTAEQFLAVSLTVPSGMGVRMLPVSGDLATIDPETQTPKDSDLLDYIELAMTQGDQWVPLLSGSRLFGMVTWTRRQVQALKWSWVTRWKTLYTPTVSAVQQDINAVVGSNTNLTSLTLWNPYSVVTRAVQESQDASPVSGLSTFGGFWTFVDGVFVLVFGANVVYFLLGRRPLSALGLIHIFQRRALNRRWHADFPALRTEGGVPGTRGAGLVAFVRERLIDLGEYEDEDAVVVEPQRRDEEEDLEKESFFDPAATAQRQQQHLRSGSEESVV